MEKIKNYKVIKKIFCFSGQNAKAKKRDLIDFYLNNKEPRVIVRRGYRVYVLKPLNDSLELFETQRR